MASDITYKIVTSDGIEFQLSKQVIEKFITLQNCIEFSDTSEDSEIPMSISEKLFSILLTYLNRCIEKNDPMLNFNGFCKKESEQTQEEKDVYWRWVIGKKYSEAWEKEFFGQYDDDMLQMLWDAADYLNCPFLMDTLSVEKTWRPKRPE